MLIISVNYKCLGQKQYLAGEVGEKVFNLTLMNKLIRIEWVSECHKTAYEAHGYDVISMSKKGTKKPLRFLFLAQDTVRNK